MNKRRILSAFMAFMIALTTVIGGMPGIEAYANTVEKKEKFIVKHMDNERLREKFFPDLVVEETPATTDEAIEVETPTTTEAPIETEVATDSTIGTETTTEAIDTSVETLPDLTYEEVTEEIVSVEGTVTEIQELLEDPDIIAAEYDSLVTIRGDLMPQSLVVIGEDQINDTGYAGTGIKVAIIDTGIDTDNTDINLSGGISFIEGSDYDDDNGHGTALAGIIGSKADGQGLVGIAPEAQIYAVKALDSQGNGYYSDVIKGLEWCIENRMDIVVMSFGSDQYSGILHETIQEAHLQDILLIGAAGNEDSTVEYPAAYEEVMAAGSSNDDGTLTYNYTDAENIDVYAPGTEIQTYDDNQTLVSYSGSSMSVAHVAGVAAELWSYDMVKTNDMIREKIIQSSSKDQVITYPVLDGYETYLDRDELVVPGDNTGEIGETTTDEAITILEEIGVSEGAEFLYREDVVIPVKFSENHSQVIAYLYEVGSNEVIDTVIENDVVGGFEHADPENPQIGDDGDYIGNYTEPAVNFVFSGIYSPGNYEVEFIPQGGDFDFKYEFKIVSPDFVITQLDTNLTKVVNGENLEINYKVDNLGDADFIGAGKITFVLTAVEDENKTITLEKYFGNIVEGGYYEGTVAWIPTESDLDQYKLTASVRRVSGNYEYDTDDNTKTYIENIGCSGLNITSDVLITVFNADPVDTALGNYTINVEDLEIEGKNPLSLKRYYNGLNYLTTFLGTHWRHSYDMFTIDQAEYTKIYSGDGSVEFFNLDENDQYIFNDTKYSAVYSTGQGNLILEYKNGQTWTFENNRIDTIENEKGTILFTYEAEKLKKVESESGWIEFFYDGDYLDYVMDSANRIVDYGYTDGYLTDITNVDGNTWHYGYNDIGLIDRTMDPDMNVEIINVYDDQNRVERQINADNTETSFLHTDEYVVFTDRDNTTSIYYKDDKGRLNYRIYPDGQEKYVYDDNDNIIEFTDKNGNIFNYYYDGDGNLQSETNVLNETRTYEYNQAGKVTKSVNPDNTFKTFTYDEKGNLTSETDELMRTTTYVYDSSYNLVEIVLPDASTMTMAYDSRGNIITETDADNNTWTYGYDSLNRVVSVTDPNNNTTSTAYLPSGRLESTTYADNTIETRTYDVRGLLVESVDRANRTTSYTYNDMKSMATAETEDGQVTSYVYDLMQNLVEVVHPDQGRTTYTYDDAGRMTSETDPENNTTTYEYDGNGNLTKETDPNNHSTIYEYDILDRLVKVTDARGNATSYSYRYDGQLVEIKDALNNVETFVYDDAGQLISQTSKNNNTTSYSYDLLGRVISVTDAKNQTRTYEYNSLDKVTKITNPDESTRLMAYDGVGNLVSETDEESNTTTYAYDSMNRVVEITDALNNTEYITYSIDDKVASVTDKNNNTTSYSYDIMGRLEKEINPRGNETKFVYDSMGKLEEIHRYNGLESDGNTADETVTSYLYDLAGRMTRETTPEGNEYSYTYDGKENILTETDPLGNTRTFAYDENDNLGTVTEPDGNATTYAYDQLSRLTGTVEKDLATKAYAYDAEGNMTASTDGENNTTTFVYDSLNRMTTKTDPRNNSTAYQYDYAGRITRMTDALLNEYSYDYDKTGNLVREGLPEGYEILHTYDELGREVSMTDGEGYTTVYSYDKLENIVKISYPELTERTFTYDGNYNLTAETDKLNNTTTYAYDHLDRLVSTTDALQNAETRTYTAEGRLETLMDRNGNTTNYGYDGNGNLVEETDPLGNTVVYQYDMVNNRTSSTHQRGLNQETIDSMTDGTGYTAVLESVSTLFEYDEMGRITKEINPSLTENTYAYDYNGNITSMTDEDANITGYTYDENNNLTLISYDDNRTVAFAYNELNQKTSMTDWNGTTSYDLDAYGRTIKETDFENRISQYTWNSRNQKETMTYPDGSVVSYSYDGPGNLTGVLDGNAEITTYTYDAGDRMTSELLPNGVVTSYTYDVLSRMTGETTIDQDNETIHSNVYSYDKNGNTVAETENSFENQLELYTRTFFYDGNDRLVWETENGIRTDYFYDTAGNRVQKEISQAGEDTRITRYTYNKENQLTSLQGPDEEIGGHKTSDPVSLTYDGRGNTIRITSVDGTIGQYYYDATNRMTYSINKMGITSSYTYDGMGRRIKQAIDASNINVPETSKLHDQDLLEELLANDEGIIIDTKKEMNYIIDSTSAYNNVLMVYGKQTKLQRYTWGNGFISLDTWNDKVEQWSDISENKHEKILYPVRDKMGSVLLLTDDINIDKVYAYDSFGTPVETDHVNDQGIRSNIYHYAGYIYDYATSQYYVNARYYLPEAGRFAAEDRLKIDGLNRYVYVRSNTLKFVDPSGYCSAEGQIIIEEELNPIKETMVFIVDRYNELSQRNILPEIPDVTGLGGSADFIASTVGVQVVFDKEGNIGLVFQGGLKGKTDIEGGLRGVVTVSYDMENVDDLSGVATFYGFGADLGEVLAVSADYTYSVATTEDSRNVSSHSYSLGGNVTWVPAEIHTGVTNSKITKFNVYDSIYDVYKFLE